MVNDGSWLMTYGLGLAQTPACGALGGGGEREGGGRRGGPHKRRPGAPAMSLQP